MERNRWGISTGLAFKGLNLIEATKAAINEGAQVIELCPNGEKITPVSIRELSRFKQEGIDYTVHAKSSFARSGWMGMGGLEWYAFENQPAFDLAGAVNALWIVQHPPISEYGSLSEPDNERFIRFLEKSPVPVVIETGVHRRNQKTGDHISSEGARDPQSMKELIDGSKNIIGIVADVPKMARHEQSIYCRDKLPTDLDALDRYVAGCASLGVNINELQVVGTTEWEDSLKFSNKALDLLPQHGFKDFLIIIESTFDRLDQFKKMVKEFCYSTATS